MKATVSKKWKGPKGHENLRRGFLKFQQRRLDDARRTIKEMTDLIARIKKQTATAERSWREIDALDKRIRKTNRKKGGI